MEDPAAVPAEVQAAAKAVLGASSEVLAFGNLAGNGREQAVVINRLSVRNSGKRPGTLLSRAAVVEKDGAQWTQLLRCDEYLKNPRGYLGGAPLTPAIGWTLELDRQASAAGPGGAPEGSPETALGGGGTLQSLRFIPRFAAADDKGTDSGRTITVRWNSRAGLYQSVGEDGQFLPDLSTLEIPRSELR